MCRSELARDSATSLNIEVECDGLIASKLAPTGIGFGSWARARKMADILKQNGDHWPPFSASLQI
ncbi:hypothetical protein PspS04_05360 [Pseudomonas sp. S04]|nr:hypothetical protein PspS04_05360 [Pseudomonas sp. S04]QHF32316.1 hypothetical protein PspS19_05360 [Pseudomonas sp. S19]